MRTLRGTGSFTGFFAESIYESNQNNNRQKTAEKFEPKSDDVAECGQHEKTQENQADDRRTGAAATIAIARAIVRTMSEIEVVVGHAYLLVYAGEFDDKRIHSQYTISDL